MSASTIHGAPTASRAALTVQPCRVSSSARVRASSRRKVDERPQQPAEVAAADLAGDPQRLDEAVAHRVGQPLLEPVEALVEPARRAVVLGEGARRPGAAPPARASPSWLSASGSASPARTAEAMLSTASGHSSRRSAARRRRAASAPGRRHVRRPSPRSTGDRDRPGCSASTTSEDEQPERDLQRRAGCAALMPVEPGLRRDRPAAGRQARARARLGTARCARPRSTTRCRSRPMPSSSPSSGPASRHPAPAARRGRSPAARTGRRAAGSRRRGRSRPSRLDEEVGDLDDVALDPAGQRDDLADPRGRRRARVPTCTTRSTRAGDGRHDERRCRCSPRPAAAGCTSSSTASRALLAWRVHMPGQAAVQRDEQVQALLLAHLADDDPGGPHPQRLLDQAAQRDLAGALEVRLAASASRRRRAAGPAARRPPRR